MTRDSLHKQMAGQAKNGLSRIVGLWNYTLRGRWIVTRRYCLHSPRIPEAFDGYRIVQVSDLHGRMMGREQKRLRDAVLALRPDLILITGDWVDRVYKPAEQRAARSMFREMAGIAQTYAILGNHETQSPAMPEILRDVDESPVKLLRNESVIISRGGAGIRLSGLETGITSGLGRATGDPDNLEPVLEAMFGGRSAEDPYTILMGHKPEYLPLYAKYRTDLVFSGHAHGGLIRVGRFALLAPGQGLFPRYTKGIYREGHTAEIVSCGLGGPRLGIRPELVLAVLASDAGTDQKE